MKKILVLIAGLIVFYPGISQSVNPGEWNLVFLCDYESAENGWVYVENLGQDAAPTLDVWENGVDNAFTIQNGSNSWSVDGHFWPIPGGNSQNTQDWVFTMNSVPPINWEQPVIITVNFQYWCDQVGGSLCTFTQTLELDACYCGPSDVSAVFSNVESIDYVQSTPYGTVPASVLCDMTLDLSQNVCEESYYISITEWDPVTGGAIGAPIYQNGFSGSAPNSVDLANYGTYQSGTYYILHFAINPGWDEKFMVFKYGNTEPMNIQASEDAQILCLGGSIVLNAESGYTNYLWSNGATTQSVITQSPGTYSVTAWNDNPDCNAQGTINIENPFPVINLPSEIEVCNENFSPVCGPGKPTGDNLSYYWSLQGGGFVLNEPDEPCFTPTQYGTYELLVINQYGCESTHLITIVEGTGPEIHIDDVQYCGHAPDQIGLPAPYSDAISYEWSYDDGSGVLLYSPFSSHTTNYIGDGEYCLTITWSDENIPSLKGCTSTACFTVSECCEPDLSFNYVKGSKKIGKMFITIVPDPTINTSDFVQEEFVLYQYCGDVELLDPCASPISLWTEVASVIRTSGFDQPYTFAGLNPDCIYRVEHRVTSRCNNRSYTMCTAIKGDFIDAKISPNPLRNAQSVTIEMDSYSEDAVVEITDVLYGNVVYTGILQYGRPLVVNYNDFQSKGQTPVGIYNIKIYNTYDSFSKKLIVL